MANEIGRLAIGAFPSEPIKITKDNFESVMMNFPNVVIDFWAPWCGPCRAISPTIDELAREFQGDVGFGKINTDEDQQMAMNLGVMSLPTLLLFKNGKLKNKIVGSHNKKELTTQIREVCD